MKGSFDEHDNYFLGLPRELRDHIYEYHINQLTVNHITDPVRTRPINLDQSELHFMSDDFWGLGLDRVWRNFKEVRGLHPFSAAYDPDISPELEEVYLRNSTFHTAIKCAGNSAGTKDPLFKFLDSIGRDAVGRLGNLQLRILTYSLDTDFELLLNPEAFHDPKFAAMFEEERLNLRSEMRACAARLARLLAAYKFSGKIGLLGEFTDKQGLFDVGVVKKGLEVAHAAFRKGKEWKDIREEVLQGEVMDSVVKFPAAGKPTLFIRCARKTKEADSNGKATEVQNEDIKWCFVNVDFSGK